MPVSRGDPHKSEESPREPMHEVRNTRSCDARRIMPAFAADFETNPQARKSRRRETGIHFRCNPL
jgi:hypothetical protein